MINGNAVGGIVGYGKTFILIDENGNELTGVVVDEEVIFTADPNTDIRDGKVAATDVGVVTGTTTIPNYETTQGFCVVAPGSTFEISTLKNNNIYDYSFLQCIIVLYSTDVNNSVNAEYVVINDAMYEVKNETPLSSVTKNMEDKIINFNIINNSENIYLIKYVTYREVI